MSSSGEASTVATANASDYDVAFAAALEARSETFLARLPRMLKLSIAAVFLASLMFLIVGQLMHGPVHVDPSRDALNDETHLSSASDDKQETPASMNAILPEPVQLKTDSERAAAAMNDGKEGPPVHLEPAPDVGLVEETPMGKLPRISIDGRKPWQVYARPFNFQDPRPRVAIVMMDMGVSRVATDAALRRLPPPVTFSFDVQAKSVDEWLNRARQDGHETLLSLPMEPFDFPQSDPGPNALLTSLPNADNIQRLMNALRSGTGYIGVTTSSGSRFLSNSPKLMPIIEALRDRGLMILDTKIAKHSVVFSLATELGVPSATSLREIDSTPDPLSIDKALTQLEQSARLEGVAVGVVSPLPVTIERLEAWSKGLADRGIVLAPLSAVVR